MAGYVDCCAWWLLLGVETLSDGYETYARNYAMTFSPRQGTGCIEAIPETPEQIERRRVTAFARQMRHLIRRTLWIKRETQS